MHYRSIDSLFSRFSNVSEVSYNVGNISYLEMLNARSKQNQVRIVQNQLQYDIDIAMSRMATMMNFDSVFSIPYRPLEELEAIPDGIESNPGFQYLLHAINYQDAALKVEKNRLRPDLSLSYFNGTNKYAGSRYYQGFQIGVGIPLFFSEQKAKIKAGQYSWEAAINLKDNYSRIYHSKVTQMTTGLEKYKESISYYEKTGKQLSAELIRNAQKSYLAGEIDFFRLVQSIENAVEIELDYLDNLSKYNELILEINFL